MKRLFFILLAFATGSGARAQTQTVYSQNFESAATFDAAHYQAPNKPSITNPIIGTLTTWGFCGSTVNAAKTGNGWYYCNIVTPSIFQTSCGYSGAGGYIGSYYGTFTFDYSSTVLTAIGGNPPTKGLDFRAEVYDANGNLLAQSSSFTKRPCNNSWLSGSLNFTSPTANITIRLHDFNGAYDGNEIRLDNIVATMTPVVPLPVDLLSFNVRPEQCNAAINWETAHETNFKGYEIESSKNGADFTKLAFVQPSPDNKYNYTAKDISGQNFFRLKMIDQDGKFKYSNIESVTGNCNPESAVTVYPNPITNSATLQYTAAAKGEAQVAVYGIAGNRIMDFSWPLNTGANSKTIDLSRLSGGNYIVHIAEQGKPTKAIRIVKQ